MAPWMLATGAFLAISLPISAAGLTLSRKGAAAAGRLAAVGRLQQQLTGDSRGMSAGAHQSLEPERAGADSDGSSGDRRGIIGVLERSALGQRLFAHAERDLEFTSWTVSPAAYLVRRLLTAISVGIVARFLFGTPIAFFGAAVIAHLVIGRVIARQGTLYQRKVGRQTEDVIDILVAHLRAGRSLVQSLGALTDEAPTPSREEYGRVARRVALGAPVSEALRSLEQRVPVTPVALLISALNMHHRIGGDLPMLLRIAADTVREQVRLQDELRTAAAGQMLAAYIVVALPVLLFVVLYLIDRPYISGLLQPGWNLLLVLGAVMEIVGFLIMRSFTRIEL
ncbi:MAG: type II secretion system F family protein [Chloroflexota bacterium]